MYLFRSGRKKVPFSVFSRKKVPFSVFSKPLKLQKGTFFFSFRAKKRYLFRCFPSLASPTKVLFRSGPEKGTFFGVFQAPAQKRSFCVPFQAFEAQKKYLFRFGMEKGTFFCVFQASQAQKRYLFRCGPEKIPFSVFSKPLKPKKGTFFVPGKVPFSVLSKPLKPKTSTFFVPDGTFFGVFQASSPKKVLFRRFPSLSSPTKIPSPRAPKTLTTARNQADPTVPHETEYLPGGRMSVKPNLAEWKRPLPHHPLRKAGGLNPRGCHRPPGTAIFWRTLENQFSLRTGKKRYLFRCVPSLSSPKKVPFFVPDRKKVPFWVFSKPLKPKAAIAQWSFTCLDADGRCFKHPEPQRTANRTACEPNRTNLSTGSIRFTRT